MARKLVATQDNTSTSALTEPLSRAVARPIFGESVLAIDYNFVDKHILDSDITFSRASGATQTNSSGLVAYAPHNLFRYSVGLYDGWEGHSGTDGGFTKTQNATTSPSGENDATLITTTTEDCLHIYRQSGAFASAVAGSTICYSMYLKEGSTRYATIYHNDSGSRMLRCDLQEGVVTTFSGNGSYGVIDAGNGWWRFWYTHTIDAGTTMASQFVFPTDVSGTISHSGNTWSTYIWGAQIEHIFDPTAGPSELQRTSGTASNEPRFDYDKDGNSKGLLVEEARTNLQFHSNNWNSTYQGISRFNVPIDNFAVSPSGAQDATNFHCTYDGVANRREFYSRFVQADATQYTHSLYIKPYGQITHIKGSDAGSASRGACFDLINCQVLTNQSMSNQGATIEDVGNDWRRISFTYTSTTAESDRAAYWAVGTEATLVAGSGQFANFNPSGDDGCFVWGMQQEAGGFPTSLIPTTGAAATRAADLVTVTGTNFSRFFKDSEGTIVADIELAKGRVDDSYSRIYHFSDSDNSDRIDAVIYATNDKVYGEIKVGGVSQGVVLASDVTLNKGGVARIGQVYKSNLLKIFQDGVNGTQDTSVTLPVGISKLNIGSEPSGASNLGGWVRRLRYYNKRQSDSKMQSLTDTSHLGTKYKGMKAGHSLRSLFEGQDSTPVARVRRDYDSYEADYTADQISDGSLSNDHTSSEQTTLPLDVSCDASELIEGGDFTELVTNGSMEADSHWAQFGSPTTEEQSTTQKHSGSYSWYIAHAAEKKGIQSSQWVATAGEKYTVSAWIYATDGTEILSGINNTTETIYGTHTVTEDAWTHITYVTTVTTTASTYVGFFTSDSTQDFYVDDVSVVKGGWTLGAGWTTSGGVINYDDSGVTSVSQSVALKRGHTYNVSFDIMGSGSGSSARTWIGDPTHARNFDGNGYVSRVDGSYSYTFSMAQDESGIALLGHTDGNAFSMDNFSLKEVSPLATGFSTRKINSSYTGKAMRCRNQSNVEVEVGFDDNDEISLLSPITNTSQNQLSHSENFAHADWVKNNCTVQGGQADPFGGNNAYKFAALDASSNSKLMDAPVAVADGDTVTFSVHAKKGELDILQLFLGATDYAGGANHANFNLSTGAVTATGGAISTEIEAVGTDGWYRCSMTATTDEAGDTKPAILVENSATATRNVSWAGTAGEGIYIHAAQFEDGSTLSTYAQTPAISDDDSSTTATNLGLFAGNENLVTHSEDITNFWGVQTASRTANVTFAPDGVSATADLVYPDSTGGGRGLVKNFGTTLEAGKEYTLSAYLKKDRFSHARFQALFNDVSSYVWFDLENGTVSSYSGGAITQTSISWAGNNWWRCSFTVTASGTGTGDYLYIQTADSDGSATSTASGTGGMYVWGCQFNSKAVADISQLYYQATTGTALTGDVNVVNWYDQNGGEDFVNATAATQPRIVEASALVVDAGGKASLYFEDADFLENDTLGGQGRLDQYYVTDSDDTNYTLPAGQDGTVAGPFHQDGSSGEPVGSSYGSDHSLFVNGAPLSPFTRDGLYEQSKGHSVVTHTKAHTKSWTKFYVGKWGYAGYNFEGKISEMVFFPNMDSSPKRFPIEQNMLNWAGVNFVSNGTFDTDTDWTKNSGWTIANGKATKNSGDANYMTNDFSELGYLEITYTISDYVSGDVKLRVGTGFSSSTRTANGTYTEIINKDSATFGFYGSGQYSVDNVTVKLYGTDGFVTKLYDQTGNNCHATQDTASYQPKIVSGGDLITSGGKPAWEYPDGSPQRNLEIVGLGGLATLDAFFVQDIDTTRDAYTYPTSSNSSSHLGFIVDDGSSSTLIQENYGSAVLEINGAEQSPSTRDDLHGMLDGRVLAYHRSASTTGWTELHMSHYNATADAVTNLAKAKFSEMIWYDSDQHANQAGIESNINDHYSIY